MLAEKTCLSCFRLQPIKEYLRRTGQPWHVPPGSNYAVPTEPLLPRVEEDICHVCHGLKAIRESMVA